MPPKPHYMVHTLQEHLGSEVTLVYPGHDNNNKIQEINVRYVTSNIPSLLHYSRLLDCVIQVGVACGLYRPEKLGSGMLKVGSRSSVDPILYFGQVTLQIINGHVTLEITAPKAKFVALFNELIRVLFSL